MTRYTVELFSRKGGIDHRHDTKTLTTAKRVIRESRFGGQAINKQTGAVAYAANRFFETGNPQHVRCNSTILRNMASVTIRKLPNGVVKITGKRMRHK